MKALSTQTALTTALLPLTRPASPPTPGRASSRRGLGLPAVPAGGRAQQRRRPAPCPAPRGRGSPSARDFLVLGPAPGLFAPSANGERRPPLTSSAAANGGPRGAGPSGSARAAVAAAGTRRGAAPRLLLLSGVCVWGEINPKIPKSRRFRGVGSGHEVGAQRAALLSFPIGVKEAHTPHQNNPQTVKIQVKTNKTRSAPPPAAHLPPSRSTGAPTRRRRRAWR